MCGMFQWVAVRFPGKAKQTKEENMLCDNQNGTAE